MNSYLIAMFRARAAESSVRVVAGQLREHGFPCSVALMILTTRAK